MPGEDAPQMVPAPTPEITQFAPSTPEAHAVLGGPGTGKTEALVQRVRSLVQGGADPSGILVLCATPSAARAFQTRLQADGVRCTCPRDVALQIMATDEAQAHSGRDARLLAPFEMDFLMEDLKTSGLRAKRLREMLKFFYRCLTELADDDPAWLLTVEEQTIFGLLRTCLAFQRSIIEPELSNLCVNFLRSDPVSKARHSYEHVVADDYQMLSRASQVMSNMLAKSSMWVASDPDACFEVFESYPYAAGIDEFLKVNEGAPVDRLAESHCPAQVVGAVNILRADLAMPVEGLQSAQAGNGEECLVELSSADPAAEVQAVSQHVAGRLEAGTDADDIYVATLNRSWQRNMRRALSGLNTPSAQVPSPRMVSGDIRDNSRCEAARVLAALLLVADPHDGAAWRSWCGFGDYLTHSNAFMTLRELGASRALAIDAALELAAAQGPNLHLGEGFASIEPLTQAYTQGMALVREAQGLQGRPLLSFLARKVLGEGADVPQAVQALVAPFDDGLHGGEDAPALAKRAMTRLTLPRFEGQGVLVGTLQQLVGLRPQVLVVSGFVNGFLPSRDYFDRAQMPLDKAEKQHDHDVRLVRCMAGKPDGQLVLSHFDHADLETAEMLNMKIERIRLVDHVRQARIAPSDFATAMLKAR